MSLKAMVCRDIGKVFLNPNDFAEEHDLNGTICLAVVEGVTAKERILKGAFYEGVYGKTVFVHTAKTSLTGVPVQGEIFKLDGKIFYVEECTDDFGMLTIELRCNAT